MNSKERRTLRRMAEKLISKITAKRADPEDQTQSPTEKSTKKQVDKELSPPKSGTSGAWHTAKRIAQILGTVIGFLAAILGILTGYLALLPRVSVSQNEQLDPTNTFSSPFIISNEGPLPLEDAKFRCGIAEAKIEKGPDIRGAPNFGTSFFVLKDQNGNNAVQNFGSPEILPGERSTMPSCSFPWLNPVENADIGIVVTFRVGYTPFPGTRVFHFSTLKDVSGKLHWFPLPVK
jgi:hypothetical protein